MAHFKIKDFQQIIYREEEKLRSIFCVDSFLVYFLLTIF
jgi:hypothetical protein